MLRGIFLLIILVFLILSMLPLFQLATNKREPRDLRIGASYKADSTTFNIFDYNNVVSDFGMKTPNTKGDINNDRQVDINDYNLILVKFGMKK